METLLVTHREGDGKTEQMVVNQDLGVGIVGQEKKMFHKNTSDMSGLMHTKNIGLTCAAPRGGTLNLFMAFCLSPPSSSVVTSAWRTTMTVIEHETVRRKGEKQEVGAQKCSCFFLYKHHSCCE